jgi:hypothetical protein
MRKTSFNPQDIIQLSKGKPSKNKIGSRTVPHRLNAFEQKEFEIAIKKGYLAYNSKTRLALQNTFEEYQRAKRLPAIKLFEKTEIQIVSETPELITQIQQAIPASQLINQNYLIISDINPKPLLQLILQSTKTHRQSTQLSQKNNQ